MDIKTDTNEQNTFWSCSDCFIPVKGKESSQIETPREKFRTKYDSAMLTEMINDDKSHQDILEWIEKNELSLLSYDDQKTMLRQVSSKRTLIRQILEEAGNGHEIIKKILDSYVQKTKKGLEPSSNSYSVTIDFSAITCLNEDGQHEETILNDLNDLWYDSKKEPWLNLFDKLWSICNKTKIDKHPSEILKGRDMG